MTPDWREREDVKRLIDEVGHASSTIENDVGDAYDNAEGLKAFVGDAVGCLESLIGECKVVIGQLEGLGKDETQEPREVLREDNKGREIDL